MYHIPALVACLLSATVFATSPDGTGTTLVSLVDRTSFENESATCANNVDCEDLRRSLHVCHNGTCYDCYECCAHKIGHCPRGKCFCGWFLSDKELRIVAQAVLGVAVFVTCVALLSLLWKTCARRLRRRLAAPSGADLLDDTASLSSQQVFVTERLRDRPPRYEEAARDFAVEKPPPYSEVAVEVVQWPAPTSPVPLVAGGLTAHDFLAPPPYSSPPTSEGPVAATAAAVSSSSSLVPPPVPATPPVQRLQRCVRKVVMIGRLGRRSTVQPETDCGSRPPKAAPTGQQEVFGARPGHPSAAATVSEPRTAAAFPQSNVAAAPPTGRRVADDVPAVTPGNPASATM